MKKIYLALLFLCVFACSAEAASFNVGTSTINYTVPPGYVLLDDSRYAPVVNEILHEQQSEEYWGVAILVPQELLARLDKSGEPTDIYASTYIVVGYMPVLKDVAVTQADFDKEKIPMRKDVPASIRQKIEESNLALQAAGEFFWLDVRSIEVCEETDASLSLLMVSDIKTRDTPPRILGATSVMLSPILTQDRMIMIVQNIPMPDGSNADVLKDEALQRIRDMAFPLPSAEASDSGSRPSAVDAVNSVMGKAVWISLATTVVAIFFALALYFLRSKSRKKAKQDTSSQTNTSSNQENKNPFED